MKTKFEDKFKLAAKNFGAKAVKFLYADGLHAVAAVIMGADNTTFVVFRGCAACQD